jgi:hypothetical protein
LPIFILFQPVDAVLSHHPRSIDKEGEKGKGSLSIILFKKNGGTPVQISY